MGVGVWIDELLERLSRARCLLCSEPRAAGLLCPACTPSPPAGAFAAQLRSPPPPPSPAGKHAALFDAFGQIHHVVLDPLAARPAIIGREVGCALSIVDRSVSRAHAALLYQPENEAWYVKDLGSRNGTAVEGEVLRGSPARLEPGARLTFAGFEFRLLPTAPRSEADLADLIHACHGAQQSTVSQFERRAIAFAPTDDAGGFVTVERQTPAGRTQTPVPLSELDFALLHLLASRYAEMSNFEDQARGWVASADLIDEPLPFGTTTPTSNNLRGAIKRIRDKFRKHDIDRVIESRQNVGYRLMPGFDEITL